MSNNNPFEKRNKTKIALTRAFKKGNKTKIFFGQEEREEVEGGRMIQSPGRLSLWKED
jgi:hypothetical protein